MRSVDGIFFSFFGFIYWKQNFYICGRYKKTNLWRVLKIYRLEPSELNIVEDSATYSDFEYLDLLRRVHDGNRSTGGLKLVTKCFGIVGMLYLEYVHINDHNLFLFVVFMVFFIHWFRVYKIFGTLLHVAGHGKEEDWCDLWPRCIFHKEERDYSNPTFICAEQFGLF